ncbi:MAG TPA: hypothetical protein VMP68_22265 [Candidatus Eisenbacteria bacterium]|nr:hypothetical protein [Candidatus Eisenbacteria bacterium]
MTASRETFSRRRLPFRRLFYVVTIVPTETAPPSGLRVACVSAGKGFGAFLLVHQRVSFPEETLDV